MLGSALIMRTSRLLAHCRPVGGGVIISPQPRECHQVDLLILGQRINPQGGSAAGSGTAGDSLRRSDLPEIATIAKEIAPMKANDGWLFNVVVEDEAGASCQIRVAR
jgi:hypothetical protein